MWIPRRRSLGHSAPHVVLRRQLGEPREVVGGHRRGESSTIVVAVDVGKASVMLSVTDGARHRVWDAVEFAMTPLSILDYLVYYGLHAAAGTSFRRHASGCLTRPGSA
jgi:hypothetical protein